MVEPLANIWWMLVLLGLGAGVLSGALGVGSGVILVPALVTVFLLPQKSAQGTALAVMVPMVLLGALRYWWHPTIDVRLGAVALIAAGAAVGSLVGTELAYRLPGHWLRRIFAVFLVIVALRMFLVPAKPSPTPAGPDATSAAAPEAKGPDRAQP